MRIRRTAHGEGQIERRALAGERLGQKEGFAVTDFDACRGILALSLRRPLTEREADKLRQAIERLARLEYGLRDGRFVIYHNGDGSMRPAMEW